LMRYSIGISLGLVFIIGTEIATFYFDLVDMDPVYLFILLILVKLPDFIISVAFYLLLQPHTESESGVKLYAELRLLHMQEMLSKSYSTDVLSTDEVEVVVMASP
jgi:hypothetical protein